MALIERDREEDEEIEEVKEADETVKEKIPEKKSLEDLEREVAQITSQISEQSQEMKQKISLKSKLEKIEPEVLETIRNGVREKLKQEFEAYKKQFQMKMKQRYELKFEQWKDTWEEKQKDKELEVLQKKLKETYKWAFNENLYPWMYFYKTDDERDKFLQEWGEFLLDYTRTHLIHIFDMISQSSESPFKYLREREKYMREILEELAKTDFAEWLNDEKTRLRVYWKSLDEWAEKLHNYCFWRGEEILTLIDLKEAGDEVERGFGSLPPFDIRKIIEILIKKKKVKWVDKEKKTVKFLLDKV